MHGIWLVGASPETSQTGRKEEKEETLGMVVSGKAQG